MKIYILRIKTATRNLACSQRQGCGKGGGGVLISASSVPTYGTGSERTSMLKLSY